MFVVLGFVALALTQLYRQTKRRQLYAAAMLRALRTGSVVIRRVSGAVQPVNAALLPGSGSGSHTEASLVADDHLEISLLTPKHKLDLSSWTSYLDFHPLHEGSNNIIVFLEAGQPDDLEGFQAAASRNSHTHVLSHGCPVAWKAGSPFGVVLHCSWPDFVVLVDAFGQGCLTLNEDLELIHMMTISTTGRPKSLKRPKSEEVMGVAREEREVYKTRRANTDPVRLSSSRPDGETPAAQVSASDADLDPNPDTDLAVVRLDPSPIIRAAEWGDTAQLLTTKSENRQSTPQPSCDGDVLTAGSKINGTATDNHDASNIAVDATPEAENAKKASPAMNGLAGQSLSAAAQSKVLNGDKGAVEDGNRKISNGVLSKGLGENDSSSISDHKSLAETPTSEESVAPTRNGSLSEHSKDIESSVSTLAYSVTDVSQILGSSDTSVNTLGVNGSRGGEAKPTLTSVAESGSPAQPGRGESPSPADKSASRNGGAGRDLGEEGRRKPPNIVVYCGQKDSARKFDSIKAGLEHCINTDTYTIYLLPHDQLVSAPWEDNCAALLVSHDYLHDNVSKKCVDFLKQGGRVVSFGSSMEAEFVRRREVQVKPSFTQFSVVKVKDVGAMQGRHRYVRGALKKDNSSMEAVVVDPKSGDPLVIKLMLSAKHGSGQAIFSQLLLERDPSEMAVDSKTFSALKQSNAQRLTVLRYLLSLLDLDTTQTQSYTLTPAYLLTQNQSLRQSLMDSVGGRLKQGAIKSRHLTLRFLSDAKPSAAALAVTSDSLPVIVNAGDSQHSTYFDPQVYWSHLKSEVMGRVVMYTEVIPSTMPLFEGIQFSIPKDVGLIAIAGRQTSGKGRGDNAWLSPVGCAMFTLPLQVAQNSVLGERISFLQHIASLAIVHSIRTMPGYEDLDLRLKWPNDIYYGNKIKLGGVLVTSTIMGKEVHATVGCGVNVSNHQPTACINDFIQQLNSERGSNLQPLSTSETIARAVSTLERCVHRFQTKGHKDFCQLYYKYWIHGGAEVRVESEGNAMVKIRGLDEFGFLQVANAQGALLSLQPDGNSFDMLHNVIATKRE